nr:MAG TPA: hypothetical protein [Caudoviricetes sp.]
MIKFFGLGFLSFPHLLTILYYMYIIMSIQFVYTFMHFYNFSLLYQIFKHLKL